MSAKDHSKELNSLLNEYSRLNDKAEQLKVRTAKYLEKKSTPKVIYGADAKFVDSVNFTNVNDINTSKCICELPAEATLEGSNNYKVDLVVIGKHNFIIKKGSVICVAEGNNFKDMSTEARNIRTRLSKNNAFAIRIKPEGFSTRKLVTRQDINVNSIKALMEVVLGRKACDDMDYSKYIYVHGRSLTDYLQLGDA